MHRASWRRTHSTKRRDGRRSIRRFIIKQREEVIRKREEAQRLEQQVRIAVQDIIAFAEGE